MNKDSLSWTTQPMRWGQINIREHEPPDFDVEWWENYFRRIHLDGITLNAGGLIAYYPTELEDQHRSRWLGDRDLFGELVQAIKRCNMRILARIDPGESYEDVYYRHPDWFAVNPDGTPMRELMMPELYVPCMNGPYYWEFVPEIMQEIHRMYDVDGTFCSEWDGRRRICSCPRCQDLFKTATGYDLPKNANPNDMAWKKWSVWHQSRLEDLWQFWDKLNKEIKPGAIWMGNHSNKGFLADYAEMINVDNQSRQEQHPLWAVGEQGKKMRAITRGKKPYFHIFSSNSYARHVSKPEAEYRLYIADALLADSRPWFTIIGGNQDDERQFGPLEDMYVWHHKNENFLRNRQSLSEVAIAFSDRERFVPEGRRDAEAFRGIHAGDDDSFRGMYYTILRNRIPFDLVHIGRMDDEAMASYKLLIIPNIRALSDSEAEDVRRFVQRGGSVIATFETGTHDEWGNPRSKGALDELLGIEERRPVMGPMEHSYGRLHGPHPILAGLEKTKVTHNGEYVLPVKPAAGTDGSVLTLIPSYIVYPPEMAFSTTGDSGIPLLLLTEGEQGEGRRVYWTGNIDAYYNRTNSPDYNRLMLNAVKWVFPDKQPAEVAGPGLIEMHLYRQENNLQVHLVNMTNPDIWKAPVQELLPVGTQTVRVRLNEGEKIASEARCLVSERNLPVTIAGGWAEVQLNDLLDHEIIVFHLL